MSDYISKSALIEQLTEWANRNEMMGYLTSLDIVRECIGVVESQPTVDEKEIIRKAFERVVERLEKIKKNLVVNASSDYLAIHYALAIDSTIKAVKEEGGIE